MEIEPVHEILITIDVDTADFSSAYVRQSFRGGTVRTRAFSNSTVTSCLRHSRWGEDIRWYGGPQQKIQRFPVSDMNLYDFPYVTAATNSSSVVERYWLLSNGFFILIDYDTPLFLDQNSDLWSSENETCFTAEQRFPYNTHRSGFSFNFKIGMSANAKVTHMNVINRELGRPEAIPRENMIRYPIWNTRVRYGKNVSANSVMEFSNEIVSHGFNRSLMTIDDSWETCYGSMTFGEQFPDPKFLTDYLTARGFSIGLWVHPFIDVSCEPFYNEARRENYLVKSHSGNSSVAGWNSESNSSSHVDFTNDEAFVWFESRLQKLQFDYGIDTFKFDGGESDLQPEDPILTGDQKLSPSLNTVSYLMFAASFGDTVEVRTGWRTQELSVWLRMREFDSHWSENNGLKSLIPTLLQLNLNGYGYVIPGE